MKKIFGIFNIYVLISIFFFFGSAFFCGCATAPTKERRRGIEEKEAGRGIMPGQAAQISPEGEVLVPEENKKYVIFIADWGKNGPSQEITTALSGNLKLVLTIPWPTGVKPSDQILEMVKNMQIEPVLSLSEEPILPMIYETKISTYPLVEFSWPQDVSNIIFKNQVDFKSNFHLSNLGLYLRTGVISKEVIQTLRKLGMMWVNATMPDETKWGYYEERFLVIGSRLADFKNAKECLKWINLQNEKIVMLVFKDQNELTANFLKDFGQEILKQSNVEMITPEDLLGDLQNMIFTRGEWETTYDLAPWMRNASVWYKLSAARSTVEEYKNSGSANLENLDKLKNELYFLYRFDFLARAQESQDSDDYRLFQASLDNIYSLMDKKESEVVGDFMESLQPKADTTTFHVDLLENKINITNAIIPEASPRIINFSVELTRDTVIYNVELDSVPSSGNFAIDIYMDLNNTPGAGLIRLLPELDAFMKQQNGWEYALRINNNQAMLYMASRFGPNLVKTFNLTGKYKIEIPRTVLRGSPLKWGYQVATLNRNEMTKKWEIADFLCKDEFSRKKILDNTPIQLNAFRASKSK
ncbi:MAG: hypothetical protein NT145_08630 [Elusimicrobia bacterium]|nr:hypothetical protein [Elusimicrobiota bacterium]